LFAARENETEAGVQIPTIPAAYSDLIPATIPI